MIGSKGGWGARVVWAVALAAASVVALLTLTGSARAVVTSCPVGSDSWVGGHMAPNDPTPNNWNVAANWTTGVPTAATNVCIDDSQGLGTYTVNIDTYGASQAVANSITVGGTTSHVVTLSLLGVGGGVQVASPLTLTNASAGAGVLSTGAITLGSLPSTVPNQDTGGQPGIITVQSGTLVNDGTVTSQPFDNPGAANTISGGFDNEGTLDVAQNLNSNGPDVDGGTVDISSGETWALDYSTDDSSFTQTGGAINNQGTFELLDGTFTASGGTSTGNPLQLTADRSGVDIDLAGGATDSVHSQTGGANLTGDIGAGDTLWASGEPGYTQGALFVQGSYTNYGTLQLGAAGTDNTQGNVTAQNGTFTNAGTLVSNDTVGGGPNAINGPFVNTGTVTLQGSLSGAGQITNQGTITLDPSVTISAASFAQAPAGTLSVNIAAGAGVSQNPVVNLTGAANLGGALSVSTAGGQTSNVTLVQAASVSGTFPSPAFAGQSYFVVYAPRSVTLSTSAPTTTTTTTTTTPPSTTSTNPTTTTPKPKSGAKARIGAITGGAGALKLKLSCPTRSASCATTTVTLTVTEKVNGAKGKLKSKVLTVGSGTARLAAGGSRALTVTLNRAGLALLRGRRRLKVEVTVRSGAKVVKRTTTVIDADTARRKVKQG